MQSLLIYLALAIILSVIGLIVLAIRSFYPHHRLIALGFLSLGGLIGIVQFLHLRHLILQEDRVWFNILSEYSLYAFMALGFISFIYIFNKFIFREPSPLKGLNANEIATLIEQDQQNLLYLNQTLERLVSKSRSWKQLAPSELSESRREKLKTQWQQFVESSFELDLLKLRYRAFYRIDMLKNPSLHTDCFILAYAALISQHRNILALTQNVKGNDNLSTYLNHGNVELGLPPNIYSHLKFRLTHPKTLIRLNAGRAYLSLLRPRQEQQKSLRTLINEGLKQIDSVITSMPKMMLLNPVEIVEQRAFQTWYPIQKKAAEKISYVRAATRDYLITPKILKSHLSKLAPGDIMLQRREWHATNLGIPGFWTHLVFYTGTLDEIEKDFAGLDYLESKTPKEYLAEKYPETFALMNQRMGRFAPNIIEAKRPGVIVSIVEESAMCDSLAVLRPKVSKLDKFKAIEKAFSFVGRPYDYTFDFRNDKALLCSEVIYKGYQNAYGFNLETHLVNGRPIFPPNKLAQKFDAEFESANELDFVLFLDGDERRQKVKVETAETFRESSRRPKWFILRRYVSLGLMRH
jgi:hypothetical protein